MTKTAKMNWGLTYALNFFERENNMSLSLFAHAQLSQNLKFSLNHAFVRCVCVVRTSKSRSPVNCARWQRKNRFHRISLFLSFVPIFNHRHSTSINLFSLSVSVSLSSSVSYVHSHCNVRRYSGACWQQDLVWDAIEEGRRWRQRIRIATSQTRGGAVCALHFFLSSTFRCCPSALILLLSNAQL